MAKYTASITSNSTVHVCDIIKKRDMDFWFATIMPYGTWSGGTITWQVSPDGGTTKINLKDLGGSVLTSNANDVFTVELGAGGTLSDAIKLYAVMAGAGSPSITVAVFDNN